MKVKSLCLFLFVITIASSNLYAQYPFSKGVYSIGGSASLSLSTHEDDYFKDDVTTFDLSPRAGYFFTDNLEIDGKLGFDYSELESGLKSGKTTKNYHRFLTIGAGLRYFFDIEKYIPFIGVSADYMSWPGTSDDGKSISFTAGFDYFISKEIAIEPAVIYSIISYNSSNQKDRLLRFGVGINYYIIN